MDRELIEDKIESLRRCVRRIETKRPDVVEDLKGNWDIQDIIALNVTRAVQLCVDVAAHILAERNGPVPDTMGASFDELRRNRRNIRCLGISTTGSGRVSQCRRPCLQRR